MHDESMIVFLSSRRRHTIFSRDWSSDVCSSDRSRPLRPYIARPPRRLGVRGGGARCAQLGGLRLAPRDRGTKIGRAACRERVLISEVADSSQYNKNIVINDCVYI